MPFNYYITVYILLQHLKSSTIKLFVLRIKRNT